MMRASLTNPNRSSSTWSNRKKRKNSLSWIPILFFFFSFYVYETILCWWSCCTPSLATRTTQKASSHRCTLRNRKEIRKKKLDAAAAVVPFNVMWAHQHTTNTYTSVYVYFYISLLLPVLFAKMQQVHVSSNGQKNNEAKQTTTK